MKSIFTMLLTIFSAGQIFAQQAIYDVTSGNGNGIRFWSNDYYKIHMGNASENKYGPVTDFSIKMNMSSNPGRGWTWGQVGATPIAALNNVGHMQIAGNFTSMADGVFSGKLSSASLDIGSARNVNALNIGLSTGYTYVTDFHIAHKTHSGSHAILFNSYMSASQVTGGLSTAGNTKYSNDPSDYSSGAGSIMFFSNGGIMDFRISPASSGKDNNVDWGLPKLRILRSGNIGIGVANPEERLVVDGKIIAEEVKVQNVPSSDYVFEPDYPLLPLSEVETHIKEKKHLPGIPSAEQFKENGVGLGEMDDMLLRKVEELTLYVIEQSKNNEKLLEQIEQLKKENESQATQIEQLKNKLNTP